MENEKKKSIISRLPWRETIAFVIVACFMVLGLVAAAKIPREKIIDNLTESAELYRRNDRFFWVIDGVWGSCIDWYADAVLLDMAYYYDDKKPLKSVMISEYYHNNHKTINESFHETVLYDKNPNKEYIRYWHGSLSIVRPMLKWFSVKTIYMINGVLLLMLFLIFSVLMIKRKLYLLLIGIVLGLISVDVWFVPESLEYTWNFLLLPVCTAITVIVSEKGRSSWYGVMFLCFGMLTNYFDFLTTETITFTIPVLVLLYIEKRRGAESSPVKLTFKTAVNWGIGYAGAWILKWLLASIVLGENVMPYVTGHISERIGGVDESITVGPIAFLAGAITRNLKCLFPFGYGTVGMLAGVLVVLLFSYMAFVYRGRDIDRKRVLLYLTIGLIPYFRYLVLHNHAYKHFFFTYRAQAGTILALFLILNELKVWDTFRRTRLHGKKA